MSTIQFSDLMVCMVDLPDVVLLCDQYSDVFREKCVFVINFPSNILCLHVLSMELESILLAA